MGYASVTIEGFVKETSKGGCRGRRAVLLTARDTDGVKPLAIPLDDAEELARSILEAVEWARKEVA